MRTEEESPARLHRYERQAVVSIIAFLLIVTVMTHYRSLYTLADEDISFSSEQGFFSRTPSENTKQKVLYTLIVSGREVIGCLPLLPQTKGEDLQKIPLFTSLKKRGMIRNKDILRIKEAND